MSPETPVVWICNSAAKVRVRCTRLVVTAGPKRGQPVEQADHLAVGDELLVVAVLIDTGAPWPILLCRDGNEGPNGLREAA